MAVVYATGGWLSKKLIKKYSNEMYFRVFDIPEMQEMEELGWFVYRDEQEKDKNVDFQKRNRENISNFFSRDPRQPGDQ